MDEQSPYSRGQGMEPEARQYLKKVLNSVSVGLLWLLINMTAGLFGEYAIIHNGLSLKNILFYLWLLLSMVLLIFYLIRLWRKK